MTAAITVLILTTSTLCGSTVVSGILSRPTNVNLTSYNMNLVLTWNPPKGAAGSLVYTTQYKTTVTAYTVGCVNITALECDLTRLSESAINENGKYTGRVLVQSGSEASAWVESNQINMDGDTIIGSPDVSLFSNGPTIEVSIKDPVFAISALRNIYIFATYNITYWKDSQKEKAKHISNIQQNRVVLNDLDPWTKYCVQVQINTERNSNPSKPSGIVCENTTNEKESPWVAAMVTFVFMALAVALGVVAVVYRKSISNFFCPKDTLPQHFKEYLLAPPNSTIYLAMQNSHPPEEIYHKVGIITDDRTLEEGGPLEEARATCSRQSNVTM
ncbi:interleukin-10 receptor subunit beta [Scophthalmus maximus]|uniref:interleukin-10 receptor subunit beta n=1 Tax=Scophthalmus maximus TaxID=52904 RepID=UPI001FA9323D|nr:interleukin-10 receptor subunit beta [Scophthalmus maximus]XP_035507429.2 interleukin-10 receptor subunit beta [Scophthalmus maximus]XP_035507430.2 interleukin-10 receptor subunit beta [Scophthalmus maximus]